MKNFKKAETLAWILVSITILSIVMLAMIWVVSLQQNNNNYFDNIFKYNIMKENIKNLVKDWDLNDFNNYPNESYIYINNDWNNLELTTQEDFKIKNFSLENINQNFNWEKFEVKVKIIPLSESLATYWEISIKKI